MVVVCWAPLVSSYHPQKCRMLQNDHAWSVMIQLQAKGVSKVLVEVLQFPHLPWTKVVQSELDHGDWDGLQSCRRWHRICCLYFQVELHLSSLEILQLRQLRQQTELDPCAYPKSCEAFPCCHTWVRLVVRVPLVLASGVVDGLIGVLDVRLDALGALLDALGVLLDDILDVLDILDDNSSALDVLLQEVDLQDLPHNHDLAISHDKCPSTSDPAKVLIAWSVPRRFH